MLPLGGAYRDAYDGLLRCLASRGVVLFLSAFVALALLVPMLVPMQVCEGSLLMVMMNSVEEKQRLMALDCMFMFILVKQSGCGKERRILIGPW